MEELFRYIYSRNLSVITVLMILCILVWYKTSNLIIKKYQELWKVISSLFFGSSLFFIAYITIGNRTLETKEICLIPFNSFVRAQVQPELYRSMLMNVFLFFPLGLSLPYALPEKWKHNALVAILFALALSITIEFLQYYFCLGRAETDDVLCNTLGCAIGTLSYRLNRYIANRRK